MCRGCHEQVAMGRITLDSVYNGIGITTDQGLFGIAKRDGGIEVMLNGVLVWSSWAMSDELMQTYDPVQWRCFCCRPVGVKPGDRWECRKEPSAEGVGVGPAVSLDEVSTVELDETEREVLNSLLPTLGDESTD